MSSVETAIDDNDPQIQYYHGTGSLAHSGGWHLRPCSGQILDAITNANCHHPDTSSSSLQLVFEGRFLGVVLAGTFSELTNIIQVTEWPSLASPIGVPPPATSCTALWTELSKTLLPCSERTGRRHSALSADCAAGPIHSQQSAVKTSPMS